MHGDSLLMLTTKVVSNKKPPLLSDSESGGSTSLRPVKRELFFAGKNCLPTDFAIASTLSVADKRDTVQYVKFNHTEQEVSYL